jgi:hypothetical protein
MVESEGFTFRINVDAITKSEALTTCNSHAPLLLKDFVLFTRFLVRVSTSENIDISNRNN